MHLYDSKVDTFIPKATSGQIADVLRTRFIARLDQNPSESEIRSWRHSLGAFAEAISDAAIDDAWIILEYQLPLCSSRVDCMLVGSGGNRANHVLLVELKQWKECVPSPVPEIVTVGGTDLLHPSAQVRNYRHYLQDAHSAFVENSPQLSSFSYLPNVRNTFESCIFHPQYNPLLRDSPVFCLETLLDDLHLLVSQRTGFPPPRPLVKSILTGRFRPSKNSSIMSPVQ